MGNSAGGSTSLVKLMRQFMHIRIRGIEEDSYIRVGIAEECCKSIFKIVKKIVPDFDSIAVFH